MTGKRIKLVSVYLSEEEYNLIRERAFKEKVSLAEYFRACALNWPTDQPLSAQRLRHAFIARRGRKIEKELEPKEFLQIYRKKEAAHGSS